MTILEVKSLYKVYGEKDTKIEVLKNINFSVSKGEFIAITGPSGSGKSTLLHLIGGLERESKGNIVIDGISIKNLRDKELSQYRRLHVGFVFQQFNLIPILTVKENIELPLMIGEDNIDETYINDIIVTLGLESRKNHLPSQLSGGQQQRVAIGRALITKPSIILADEPTGNLDSITSEEILKLFRLSAKKYNQTLIIITHDEDIAKKADRIIHVVDGEIKIIEENKHNI